MTWREIGFDLNPEQRAALERCAKHRRELTEKDRVRLVAEAKRKGNKDFTPKLHDVNLDSFVYDLFQPRARNWRQELNRLRVVGYTEQQVKAGEPKVRIYLDDVEPFPAGKPLPLKERGPSYLVVRFPPTPLEWLEWGLGYQNILNRNAGDDPSGQNVIWESFDEFALRVLVETLAQNVTQFEIEDVEKAEETDYYSEMAKLNGKASVPTAE
jgi:hypothetical protein